MRSIRRIMSLGLVGSLLVVPASLPAVAQSGAPAKVTHRQSVQTELSPTGGVGVSRVYTQVVAEGEGTVDVALPAQATGSLRNLEGFGNPTVDGDTVTYSIDAEADGVTARTVADNTAEQPVDISGVYDLDGEEVKPRDIVGATGTLTATYTVRNRTSVPEEITYFNGQGQAQQETVDVSVPMVGSLSTTLDGRFSDVTAPGAAVAGDGRGNTVVNASLLLFAPIGSETAVTSWSAQVDDAIVPPANIQILPVNSRSFNSIRSTQDSFKGVSGGLTDLTNGALIVDGNAKLLADGAAQLFDGLQQLEDGAGELGAGLSETAAPGARTLADGLGTAREGGDRLADGLDDLSTGAGTLSAGLGTAREGGDRLASGLGDLSTGAGALSDGLGTARAGGDRLADGAGELNAGATGLLGGLNQLKAGLNAPEGLPSAIAGVSQLSGGVEGLIEGIGAATQTNTLLFAQSRAAGGLSNDACVRSAPQDPDNPCGLLEVMQLLRSGIGDPADPPEETLLDAVRKIELGLSNTECDITAPTDPSERCGIREGSGAIQGGAEKLAPELAQARGALQAVLAGNHVNGEPVALLPDTPPADAVVGNIVAQIGDPEEPETDTALDVVGRIEGGAGNLVVGVDQLVAGLGTPTTPQTLRAGIAQIEGTLAGLEAAIGAPTTPETLRFAIAGTIRGLDNPSAFAPGASQNLACLSEGDAGWTSSLQPCGLKQGLQLVAGGLEQLDGGLAGALGGVNEALGVPADGANSLIGGASLVAGGSSELAEGAQTLSGGLVQLEDGAGQLADGSVTARDGARALQGGLVQLDDGAGELADGSNTARQGAQSLADGLVQLDDGAERLAGGLQDAADGSVQLAEGAAAAAEGGERVADGTVALSEQGIGAIITGATDAAGEPDLLYEHLRAADRRGQSPDALPYGTTDRANASAVFAYELAGMGVDEGPSLPVQGALALIGLALLGGLGMYVRRRVV